MLSILALLSALTLPLQPCGSSPPTNAPLVYPFVPHSGSFGCTQRPQHTSTCCLLQPHSRNKALLCVPAAGPSATSRVLQTQDLDTLLPACLPLLPITTTHTPHVIAGLPQLYGYMLTQRKKVLGGGGRPDAAAGKAKAS